MRECVRVWANQRDMLCYTYASVRVQQKQRIRGADAVTGGLRFDNIFFGREAMTK